MQKLRILLASSFYRPRYGGVEYHVEWLAKTLSRLGHHVYVLTNTGKTGIERNDITVIRVSLLNRIPMVGDPLLISKFKRIFANINPDIVHAHHAFSFLGTYSAKISKDLGKPAILTNHSIPPFYSTIKPFWDYIARGLSSHFPYRFISLYDSVIAVSNIAAEFIRHFYPGKVHIIPNAIDTSEFNITASRDELGIPPDDPVILVVGRASPKKGFERALLVFKFILRDLPNARLYIVGPSGRYLSWLSSLARLFGVEKRAYILGQVSREYLIKLYKVADVYLHPAYGGESFGIVLLEAMASGLPIVSTSGDGLGEILRASGAGICVKSTDPSIIAKEIVKIIRDTDLRKRLSERGLSFVRMFSWDVVSRRILRIYYDVIQQ